MKIYKKILVVMTILLSSAAFAADENSLPAVNGYDVVAYHTQNKAVRGTGWNVASYKGKNYLFSSKENKVLFEKNPAKYVPVYNGWCAFGVALKKKFHPDPTVFEVVDGKLYLNLDKKIQKKWSKDKKANIKKADGYWNAIESKSSASL